MNFSNYILPFIVAIIMITGLVKRVDLFGAFIEGAKGGFKTVLNIMPSLIALILGINMLKVSGGLDILISVLSPVVDFFGIPREVVPLAIISPISGSGSLAMFESILKDYGADSFVGRVASVVSGATETTFYAVTLYFGSVGIKKTRHTLPCALCAEFTSFILAPVFVTLFFQ